MDVGRWIQVDGDRRHRLRQRQRQRDERDTRETHRDSVYVFVCV